MAMRLTLHPEDQRLKTNRRRKQQWRNQHQDTTTTDSSGVRPYTFRTIDNPRSLSAGHISKRKFWDRQFFNTVHAAQKARLLSAAIMATGTFSPKRLPCTFCGCGNWTAPMKKPLLSTLVRRAIGNAKRVGQRCVGQPEELRSVDQITRENASSPWCEHRIRAMEDGATHWSRSRTGNRDRGDLLAEVFCFGP